jgi:multiple sugar transport system ATP-binding protein
MLGSAKLNLSGAAARAAADRPQGADLLIGFRPEHLDIADGAAGAVRIPAKVDVVEYLGNEELIHAQAEGNEIVALIPSDRKVRAGDNIELGVPLDKLHVFDPETEKSLVA